MKPPVRSLGLVLLLALSTAGTGGTSTTPAPEPAWQDLFALRLIAPEIVHPGRALPVRVQAFSPYTLEPRPGIEVEAVLTAETAGGEVAVSASGRTGPSGEALLELPVPEDVPGGSYLDLRAVGRGGGQVRRAEVSMVVWGATAVLSTDKAIYRPGQELRMRALWRREPEGVLARSPVSFEIRDPKGSLVYSRRAETSPAGIATADWSIPERMSEGSYRITAAAEATAGEAVRSVEIAAYELPRFTVTLEPARPWFVAGEEPRVVASVASLAGAPIPGARVEVEPDWWPERWGPAPRAEGITGPGGTVSLPLDLARYREGLDEGDAASSPFRDVAVVATARHPASGREERARARLRLTRDPIHVYPVNWSLPEPSGPAAGVPHPVHVTTFTAGGEPVACEVGATLLRGEEVLSVARFRTNELGVGRLDARELAAGVLRATPEPDGGGWLLEVEVVVQDGTGRTGRTRFPVRHALPGPVAIEAEAPILRPEEPVRVRLVPLGERLRRLLVTLEEDGRVRESVELEGLDEPREVTLGRGLDLAGPVTVTVRDLAPGADRYPHRLPTTRRSFVALRADPLRLDLRPDRAGYRPGETLELRLRTTEGGSPASSVVGLAVVDRAVELRQEELTGTAGPALLAAARQRSWTDTVGEWSLDRIAALDPTRPVPEGLELVAEVLLARRWPAGDLRVGLATPIGESRRRYRDHFVQQLAPVKAALEAAFQPPRWRQPETVAELLSILREHWPAGRPAPDRLLDPWGQPYHPEVKVQGDRCWVVFHTAGRDGRWATIDDFEAWSHQWRYFAPVGERLEAVLEDRLGRGVLVRDAETLRSLLADAGVPPDGLVDPWGTAYRFELWSRAGRYGWEVWSAGPDGRFEGDGGQRWRDVRVWSAGADFGRWLVGEVAEEVARQVEPRVAEGIAAAERPASLEALEKSLAGIDLPLDGDPWGRPLRFETADRTRYTDLLVHRQGEAGGPGFLDPRAVTVRLLEVRLTSRGPDGRWDTEDDRSVARFAFPYRWEGAGGEAGEAAGRVPELAEGLGLLAGTVLDDAGNPLPGVGLQIDAGRGAASRMTFSDAAGLFHFTLPAGNHALEARLEGFSNVQYPEVEVLAGRVTWLDLVLTPAIEEVITVTSESPLLEPPPPPAPPPPPPSPGDPGESPTAAVPPPLSTPRLRQDFPETLLWLPEVEIGADGEARVEVPLADNITTWSVAALASDRAGELAWAEARVAVSQPFYAEPDLPPALTAGDRIDLPVILANLTGEPLPVEVRLESPGRAVRSLVLPAGAEGRADLPLAFPQAGEVPVRVTARGGDLADAIERTTRVRPPGREVVEVASAVLPVASEIELAVPEAARPGTAELEVLVYPDLASHLREATAELLRRPAGCGEQIVSAAWPGLLLLELPGADGPAPDAVERLEAALSALASVRTPQGGFAYWPEGRPDPALTAYVLDFLREASEHVAVDESQLARAARWLARSQGKDGLWRPDRGPAEEGDPVLERRITAVVALSLARLAGVGDPFLAGDDRRLVAASLERALALLRPAVEGSADPYALAAYALALEASGDREGWGRAAERLAALATQAEGGLYWEARYNTPFHGWGRSGRFETTGLAVQALLAGEGAARPGGAAERGLAYLLRSRGADDLWGSTQATVQALRAVVAGLGGGRAVALGALPEPRLDGAELIREADGGDETGGAPVRFRAAGPLELGAHRVTVAGGDGGWTLVQAVLRYRVPWGEGAVRADSASHLRLDVACTPEDPEGGIAGEPRECRLSADRVGFRGGGMLIAELGLPPGAEVDRRALEEERRRTPGFSSFELRPDRVVLYLWPRAGGVRVPVRFTPRMGLDALTAPSALYDYYNPDARVTLPPVRYRLPPPPTAAAGSRTAPAPPPPPR